MPQFDHRQGGPGGLHQVRQPQGRQVLAVQGALVAGQPQVAEGAALLVQGAQEAAVAEFPPGKKISGQLKRKDFFVTPKFVSDLRFPLPALLTLL